MGNSAWFASCASLGQCWKTDATLVACAKAISSLSVCLLRTSVMCSIPVRVDRSLSGAYPRPISFVGRCVASVRKVGMGPKAFLAALLRIMSIVSSCLSMNIPKKVA